MVGLIVASFCDLALSKAIFEKNSNFGKFFETAAEMPATIIAAFSAMLLIMTRPREKKWLNIVSFLGYGAIFLMAVVCSGYFMVHYSGLHFAIGIVSGVLFAVATYSAARMADKSERKKVIKMAVIGIVLVVTSIIVINILKVCWNRVRFRNMSDGDYSAFSMWAIPQKRGVGLEAEAYKSFPSGHAGNAAIVIWLLFLPQFFKSLNNLWAKIAINVGVVAWITMSCFSRIVIGAHFLSDTLIGTSITLLIFVVLRIIFKEGKKDTTDLKTLTMEKDRTDVETSKTEKVMTDLKTVTTETDTTDLKH